MIDDAPNYLLTTYAVDNAQGSVYYQVKMSSSQPPKLLDQIRNLVRLRHMSHKTGRAYVSYARDYILFHKKRHRREMSVDEIRDYLTHLAVDKNVAASTQNVATPMPTGNLRGSMFFLRQRCRRPEMMELSGATMLPKARYRALSKKR